MPVPTLRCFTCDNGAAPAAPISVSFCSVSARDDQDACSRHRKSFIASRPLPRPSPPASRRFQPLLRGGRGSRPFGRSRECLRLLSLSLSLSLFL